MRVFQRTDEQIKSNGIIDKKTATSESAIPIGIKKYDFIELRFQMMREILRFNIRGIFLLVIVMCFLGTNKRIYAK